MSFLPAAIEKIAVGLALTWRLEVIGEEAVSRARREGPILFTVWHGQMLAPLWHRRRQGVTLLVSAHEDGTYIRSAARSWGYRVVLGSSTRGGAGGLRRLVRALQRGTDGAITPDGPRGPARCVKGGVISAAALSGASIVPVAAVPTRAWRLGSWDQFIIPAPASRVRVAYGAPIRFERGVELQEGVARLEQALGACEVTCRNG